jgi:hypothetical protein
MAYAPPSFLSFVFAVLTCEYRPKHRNLVLSDVVEACMEEHTLLNEAGGPIFY